MLDGLVDSWSPLVGYIWGDACLLQGEQVVGTAVWLHGRVPADDDGCGAEDLSSQVSDRVTWH